MGRRGPLRRGADIGGHWHGTSARVSTAWAVAGCSALGGLSGPLQRGADIERHWHWAGERARPPLRQTRLEPAGGRGEGKGGAGARRRKALVADHLQRGAWRGERWWHITIGAERGEGKHWWHITTGGMHGLRSGGSTMTKQAYCVAGGAVVVEERAEAPERLCQSGSVVWHG